MNKQWIISILLLIEFGCLCYGQSKVTSTTVITTSPIRPKQEVLYTQGELIPPSNNQFSQTNDARMNDATVFSHPSIDTIHSAEPKTDVTYSEPKYQHDTLLKDRQLNMYKRPSQFDNLIKNQQLLDKQNAAISLSNGRLSTSQFNEQNSNESSIERVAFSNLDNSNKNQELTSESTKLSEQFAQSLNYLIKYLNRQGQPKLINGTEQTENADNILLKHARNYDRENCLLRLICEIGSNEADASDNQLIKEIRLVFGHKNRAPAYPLKKKHSSFPFFYAGHVGATNGSAERCLEVFPECSARTELLLQIVANANKYSLNKAKLDRKADKIMHYSKLERELYPSSESRSFSEKMRNKMKKIHKQYIKKLN